ncbi:MAG: prephenate dehydrogenase [Caulobacteraceae bacterium]
MPAASPDAPPTLGLIGFGAFGRLIAQHLQSRFPIRAYDPAWPAGGDARGVEFADIASVARCPIVILAMPVDRLATAIEEIRPHLQPGALVLDVGSVKVRPARIMRERLPPHVDIVGTHPLFGPQSARGGLTGLKIAICPIRGERAGRVAAFLRKALGLRVFITTPEAHDREAAIVQGLTHLIAKVLVQMEPLPTRMTTASFDKLMGAVEMVRYDPPSVFLAIEQANPYAVEVRERFFELADQMRASLAEHAAEASGDDAPA